MLEIIKQQSSKSSKRLSIEKLVRIVAVNLVIVMTAVLAACSSAPDKEPDDIYTLNLNIFSDSNLMFNKYAITVSLDGTELGTVDNGEEFNYTADVTRGEHTIEFCKEGKKKPNTSKTISVTDDTAYKCQLKHDGFAIKIIDESIESINSDTNSAGEVVESTSETIIESTEAVGNIADNNNLFESVETTSIPTPVSENISYLSFDKVHYIEIMEQGDPFTGTISAVLRNKDSISDSDIIIVSENPDIASVECTGTLFSNKVCYKVKPISVGETFIYAITSDGVVSSTRVKVTVTEYVEVEQIELESIWITEECVLDIGQTVELDVEISPEDATDQKITWSSRDNRVVTVDNQGRIKGIGYGKTEVTAKASNGLSATCDVTVAMTQREMKLKCTVVRDGGDNIGSEWIHVAKIDGESIQKGTNQKYTLNAGETYEFYCCSTEDDNVPDVGDNTVYYTVTEDDLLNGFTVEVEVCITENRGKNAGKSAYYIYKFVFSV